MTAKMIFKPRSSTGWVWVGMIGLVLTGLGIGLAVGIGFSGPFMITILVALVIGAGFLLIAACFPAMRYAIDDIYLHISYGPLLHYKVELAEIKNIRRRDLSVSVISSFRFPGLALFGVPYPEVGVIKMCATAAGNRILLIETGTQKYGITPSDEAGFVAELRKRMGE